MLTIDFKTDSYIATVLDQSVVINYQKESIVSVVVPNSLQVNVSSTQQFLPSQLNQSGRYLKTNGVASYWSVIPDAGGVLPPESGSIIRDINDEISSIEYESGKVITINRANGEITSIYDGEYLKTIVRENNEITGIIIS